MRTESPRVFVPPADFSAFGADVWLNCAHQGPLPVCAAEAVARATEWKQRPFELTAERFREVPARLRRALERLIGADADTVVLGNSASYGLHLIASALKWSSGDEVLVMDTDFPSDILPWLRLENRGVSVRRERPHRHVFDVDEIAALLSQRTRLLCLTWVHSFSGWAIDLDAIGRLCQANGVTFVVNGSQGVGARPFDVATMAVDAVVSVGFKWLCGPYGTGFCWIRPSLREQLVPPKAYWLSMLTADDLSGTIDVRLRQDSRVQVFDLFGTANFLNFVPWTASVEYLLQLGIPAIAEYDQTLVDRLLDRLDRDRYDVISPMEGPRRSTLVVIRHRIDDRTARASDALRAARIHVAMRSGSIRLSPHFFNSADDIDGAVDVLNAV